MAVELAEDETKREKEEEEKDPGDDSHVSSWASGEFLPADIYGYR